MLFDLNNNLNHLNVNGFQKANSNFLNLQIQRDSRRKQSIQRKFCNIFVSFQWKIIKVMVWFSSQGAEGGD